MFRCACKRLGIKKAQYTICRVSNKNWRMVVLPWGRPHRVVKPARSIVTVVRYFQWLKILVSQPKNWLPVNLSTPTKTKGSMMDKVIKNSQNRSVGKMRTTTKAISTQAKTTKA